MNSYRYQWTIKITWLSGTTGYYDATNSYPEAMKCFKDCQSNPAIKKAELIRVNLKGTVVRTYKKGRS